MNLGTLRRGQNGTEHAEFESLVDRIYQAATESGNWAPALERMRDAFRGISGILVSHDFASATGRVRHAVGCAPEYVRSYADHYAARDVWFKQDHRNGTPGAAWTGRQLVPHRELVKSEFYAGWLRPQGWFHTIHSVVHRDGDEVWYIAVAAPRSTRAYGEGDLALLRRLAPHVRRALQFQHVTSELRLRNRAAMEALDRLPVGVALLSAAGRVLATNATAEEIVARRDGLRLCADRFEATHNGDNSGLQALIAGAGGPIALSRSSGHRPLSVLVSPMSRSAAADLGSEGTAVVVFLDDPERAVEIDTDRLRQLYALTRTEARLAAHLTAGRRLDACAEAMGITSLTARTHLKHIFSKTGTARQAELVGLLLRGPAQFRTG